jgi:D-methionine transport system ATP-binding protein
LPLPPGPAPLEESDVWQLRYARPDVDPAWLTSIGRELDTDIAVLAGLIETIDDGGAAGRMTVRIDRPLPPAEVQAAFAARGIHATRGSVARADELESEPEERQVALARSAA